MSPEKPLWKTHEPSAGLVFQIQLKTTVTIGTEHVPEAIMPALIATRVLSSSHGKIFISRPSLNLAALYHERATRRNNFHPMLLPLPSLLFSVDRVQLTEIPAPIHAHWPPYAHPLLAPLLAAINSDTLVGRLAAQTLIRPN